MPDTLTPPAASSPPSHSASNGFGTLGYGYDKNGNRQSETRTANGNTASTSTATFTYDGFNRLASSQTAAETTTYTYNALGQRIKKINQNGLATVFHYGPNGELLYEQDQAGNSKVYVWLDGRPIARIDNDANIYYYHVDHLGTPWAMTDATGTTVWKANYEPFGKATVTTSTIENNLRLPGQYYDRETGMHQNYFRDFDPTTGRYNEFDLVGLRGGLNGYSYAKANPLRFTDPLGLTAIPPGVPGESGGGIPNPYDVAPYPNIPKDNINLECAALCATEQYMICAPWGVTGIGIGKPVGGAAASTLFGPEMYVPGSVIGGRIGGFAGTQICKQVLTNKGCYEKCDKAKNCGK